MSANLYFLISNSSTIVDGPSSLPITFFNVSNFNNLETSNPELLINLNWINRPDLGFWLAVFDPKPTVNYFKKIISTNTINQSNNTVIVSYTEVDLTEQELEEKRTRLIKTYTPIRDSYLKLTDFTQLSDAPISVQAKADFVIFRQQLRDMFDIDDFSKLTWPPIPTSAPNIIIPSFPPMPSFNG